MKIDWIATNEIIRAVVAADSLEEKQAIYRDGILRAWQPMMQMMGGAFQSDPNDEFGVARAWAWYLPDELQEIPQVLLDLEAAEAWKMGEEALHKAVECLGDKVPFEAVEGWLMPAVKERSNPIGRGYTGAIDWSYPRFVCQYDTVTEANLRALAGAAVHEFNHLVRLRAFPWDMRSTTVAQYIIHEGVAESFAKALFGEEVLGYYVTDISRDDLQTAGNLIAEGLEKTGFDLIRGYIFGDTLGAAMNFAQIGMPDYGGYAVGYHVVQAYMQRRGKSIAEVTFAPAMEIVKESGYFA